MIRELEARELRAGMTAYVLGRYRELAYVAHAAPANEPRYRDGRPLDVVIVTACSRGTVLALDDTVRVRPTDRGVAM